MKTAPQSSTPQPSAPPVRICIPARLESSRLPRKLLLTETGKPLIQHTCENAARAKIAGGFPPLVITDSAEIAMAVLEFGGYLHLGPPAGSGTERIARFAKHSDAQIFVNVQGDEPEIWPAMIDALAELLAAKPDCDIATLAAPIDCRNVADLHDPNCVKVVCNHGVAMYFSRAPIPFPRNENLAVDILVKGAVSTVWNRHIGVYAYRKEALSKILEMYPTPAERMENLEQLRWLEHGMKIAVGLIPGCPKGIDTPEDYREFVARQRPSQAESSQSPESSAASIKELCE